MQNREVQASGERPHRVLGLTRPPANAVRRVSVVGTSGAGKSTVASALALVLGAVLLELDSVHHQADWTPLPAAEFRAVVAAAVAGERWVIDGNYSSVQDLVWARADTVVWLDLPRRTVMRRVIWRTVGRVAGRVELWNGNRERWRNFFTLDKEESVIAWAWQTHASNRARYEAAMADPAHAHLRFIRLRSPKSVRRFLREAEHPRLSGSISALRRVWWTGIPQSLREARIHRANGTRGVGGWGGSGGD